MKERLTGKVEVFDIKRGIWIPATVVRFWSGVKLGDGEDVSCYEVEGYDNLGHFDGRWEPKYVRKPNSPTPSVDDSTTRPT